MAGIIALKMAYNRSTKQFDATCIENADVLLVHDGWFVFDSGNIARILQQVKDGVLLAHWTTMKTLAAIQWLETYIANQ